MTIPHKRRLDPVPHEPSHRRAWRSLWRRCSCGLPAPCVDRLVPAPRLPFPPDRGIRSSGRLTIADDEARLTRAAGARDTGSDGRPRWPTHPVGSEIHQQQPDAGGVPRQASGSGEWDVGRSTSPGRIPRQVNAGSEWDIERTTRPSSVPGSERDVEPSTGPGAIPSHLSVGTAWDAERTTGSSGIPGQAGADGKWDTGSVTGTAWRAGAEPANSDAWRAGTNRARSASRIEYPGSADRRAAPPWTIPDPDGADLFWPTSQPVAEVQAWPDGAAAEGRGPGTTGRETEPWPSRTGTEQEPRAAGGGGARDGPGPTRRACTACTENEARPSSPKITGGEAWPASEGRTRDGPRPTGEADLGNQSPPTCDTLFGSGPGPTSETPVQDAAWPPAGPHPAVESRTDAWRDPRGPDPARDPAQRESPSCPPAWNAPTVLLFQVGRAGDLTPGQAYRAGRGRTW
jgi:hypothetical protein